MHARIGMLRALNADKLREFTESKAHHWSRGKQEGPMTVLTYVNTAEIIGHCSTVDRVAAQPATRSKLRHWIVLVVDPPGRNA
jgi:hypothetical protein